MPNTYPTEFKKQVIQRYTKGESIQALSEELHIAQSTIYSWRKLYCSIKTPNRTYTPREFDKLSSRLRKLEHEKEILQLSGCLTDIPLQKKLSTLEKLHEEHEQFSVHELCDALGVARGTFYNHIFRRVDPKQREDEQTQLMLKVQQIFDDSSQRYGAEKIRVILAQSGIRVSKERVLSIMQELGIRSIRTDAKKQHKKYQKQIKLNLLDRNFTTDRPNKVWVSDITYFNVNNYWVHLCVIIDLFSRKVIAYKISRNASTQLVNATFQEAYQLRGKPKNLTFHSDRGCQYTSIAFMQLLQKNGIKQSFSASGSPHDNAVSETFFANFKKEEAYRRIYTSEKSFRKSVDQYIKFYNETRPHQTLKYQTPQGFEDDYYSKH